MLIGQKGVKYGLQVRGAKPAAKAAPLKKRSVFGDDDDEDDAADNVEQQIARQAARKQSDAKVAELHAAALAEDASIFDYDSHYDSIQQSRAEPKKQEKLQRQSRYIAGLLEKAEERKQEQDILYERQLAKERAAEDHLFGDKEKFVTAAYRAKLAERQAYVEEQKKKRAAEEADSVEKRGHMGDFYRNLLRSNVAFGGKPADPASKPAAAAAAARPEGQRQQQQEGRRREGADGEPGSAEQGEAGAREEAARGGAEQREQREGSAAPPTAAAERPQQPAAAGAAAYAPAAAEAGEGGRAAAAGPASDAGQRRNKEDAVAAARERYLARKRQKT